jgi:large subunit ribosomal protein L19
MNRENIIRDLEKDQLKTGVADVRVGDSVKVHYKIREGNKDRIQIFQGLVIDTKSGKTLQGSFTVRKVVAGVGVERTFPLHSPWIIKIERTKSGKVRRAKLTYVRKYALSSKFKLKDKGVEGTVWEEIAKEQQEIAKEEAHEAAAETVPEAPTKAEQDLAKDEAVEAKNEKADEEISGGDSAPVADDSAKIDSSADESESENKE